MGNNKKENFIFGLIACSLMVLGMVTYNAILSNGIQSHLVQEVALMYVPVFCLALFYEWFIVSKIARRLVSKIVSQDDPLVKKILFMSFFMVTGMCFLMTLSVVLISKPYTDNFMDIFLITFVKNFIVALPLQLLVAGPIARLVFFKIYPPVGNK
ncbi:DUF2798 domain-containing protein [Sulfurospirillum arcachonense]|uniref:DUF2798 domain-containing protein n=1 Tax=Sulfurospirillum arcachonense TaxID=57666 RepID=UPI0004684718|nr:DUF2798 domain-containing protein [Sulfurospirillum arcachonense]